MRPASYENKGPSIELTLPWDKITARSFVLALLINSLVFLLMFNYLDWDIDARTLPDKESIPVEIVYGLSIDEVLGKPAGNLQKKGRRHKGDESRNLLEDAQASAADRVRRSDVSEARPDAYPNPVPDVAAAGTKVDSTKARRGARSIGDPGGRVMDRGLADFGSGRGRGAGYGKIDWGGGGNRTVLDKVLPEYPPGIDRSVEVKMRFFVEPGGRVTKVLPIAKGEPSLSRRAVEALKQWKFSPLDSEQEMVGVITFTFQI